MAFGKLTSSLFLGSTLVLGLVGCGASDSKDAPSTDGTTTPGATDDTDVSKDDVLFADDVTYEDASPSGAVKVGDAAALLEATRVEGHEVTAKVRSILGRLKDVAEGRDPDIKGKTRSGQRFGVWKLDKDGTSYSLAVIRTAPNRLRYVLSGRNGASQGQLLLTGVFIRRASGRGVGRLHLNLTAAKALNPALPADGRLHVYFSNAEEGVKARRVLYRDVRVATQEPGDPGANVAFDFLHKPGTGGRIRAVVAGNLADKYPNLTGLAGIQLAAIRVGWTPAGGRADAVLFDLKPAFGKVGEIHECWTGGGLRAAYKTTLAAAAGENDGDPLVDFTKCGNVTPDADAAGPTAEAPADPDPEVTADLAEAVDIADSEADDATETE